MPGPKLRLSCPVADSMEIAAPSAVAMLSDNKTTALADSEKVHQVPFLRPANEDCSTKPPSRRTHDGLAELRLVQMRAPEQRERCSPAAPCPQVLDPVLRHLDAHTIQDGARPHPLAPPSEQLAVLRAVRRAAARCPLASVAQPLLYCSSPAAAAPRRGQRPCHSFSIVRCICARGSWGVSPAVCPSLAHG